MDIDITQDLDEGNDAYLADNVSANEGKHQNAQGDVAQKVPDGTVHVNDTAPAEHKDGEFNLRDQLSNAFKGNEAKPADEQQQQATPVKYEGPALQQDSDGKWRTPDGLFASSEQVAAYQAAQAGTTTEQQTDFTPVMENMTPVEQEQFKALPAEIQQFVGRTMETLNGQAAKYAEYDQLEQLIGPRREAWGQNGMNSVVALNQLFALSDFASRQPKDFVLWFADQHNIDLDAALDEREVLASQQNAGDPVLRQLQGQVQQLTSMLTQQGGGQQQQNADLIRQVEAFAMEKDEANNLKRPYLPQVNDTWPTHIASVRQANPSLSASEVLQKAYENACWANPAVRNSMQQEAQKRQQQQAQQQAEKARLAGSSINGGPNGRGTSPNEQDSNLSLRDELARQFAEARA